MLLVEQVHGLLRDSLNALHSVCKIITRSRAKFLKRMTQMYDETMQQRYGGSTIMRSLKLGLWPRRLVLLMNLIFWGSLLQIFVFLRWSSPLQIQSENDVIRLTTDIDYDAIYTSFGTHETYKDKRLFNFSTFETYSSTKIASNGCSLTVTLTDPRLPSHGYNDPVWFSLESMASYVPYACVVIHTASCQIIKQTSNMPSVPTKLHQIEVAAQSVYERSLPLFRRMMEGGRVRISVLEKGKYNIKSCDKWDISAVNMNVHFWKDEFIEGVDSDMILVMQSDAVLCHHLDIDLWKHFAYVGGPWKPDLFSGGCVEMRRIWKSYAPLCNLQNPDVDLPHLCTPGHGGLVGNGGLSIRNKQWMIKAIETCPTEYSGMDAYQHFGHQAEDVYFSTVLNGIQAPMPTAFEASLFAVEPLFPEQTLEAHFSLTTDEILDTVRRLWGNNTGKLIYDRMHRIETYILKMNESDTTNQTDSVSNIVLRTIPIGFHQVWRLHPQDVLSGVQIQQECKFLKFLYNAKT